MFIFVSIIKTKTLKIKQDMKAKILIILSLFLVGNSYSQYCSGGPSSTSDSNVENVTLNGESMNINHDGCVGGAQTGAEDLTSQIANLIAGNSYTLSVTFGSCGGNYSGAGEVWIDYNQNETFEASESIGTWSGTPTSIQTFTFTVPGPTTVGSTRMRVMQRESGSLPLDPCGSYLWGSVMDFGISILANSAVNCSSPTNFTTANVTTNSVDLSWTTGGGLFWLVEYGEGSFLPGNGDSTILVTAPTATTITGLNSATNYTFYVQDVCGIAVGDTSFSVGPKTILTPGSCGTYVLDLVDSYGDGWNGGAVDVLINGVVAYSGLTLASGAGPISFNIPLNELDVISIDYTGGSFTSENEYTLYDELGVVVVAEGASGATPEDLDVYQACPTCPRPSNLTGSSITETSVELSWTTGGAADWIIEYGAPGFTPGTGTVVNVSTNPYTLSGLSSSTLYDVYVKDSCGAADLSINSNVYSFGSTCGIVTAPYYYNFDGALTLPYCWSSAGSWVYTASNSTAFPSTDYGVDNALDHTTGTGNFAWVNGLTGANELVTPSIDFSGLTQGIVGCWVLSNNVNDVAQNNITLEGFDGTNWISLVTYSGNDPGWIRFYSLIPATLPSPTVFRLVQAEGTAGGFSFYNDILVDDFFVEEAPTCLNSIDLMDSVLSPTTVELSWTSGGASDWIIEYGPTGFIPGTGAGTLVTTDQNPFVLDVMSGQDYDWYVQDSCSATDVSWLSYVNDFRMPGEVICDSVSTNFTYCYVYDEIETYTYQSSNSSSFLHVVFNAGEINYSDDFIIYDGPDNTYPILYSVSGTTTDVTGVEFTSSSNIISFSFDATGWPYNDCSVPLDFDINCCENNAFTQLVHICVDSSYTLPDGVVVDEENDYYSTIPNVGGCDSVITTIVRILADSTTSSDVICVGTPYSLPDGSTTTTAGNYVMDVTNYLGCDSAVNLTLTLAYPSSSTRNASICSDDFYQMPNGTTVNTSGTHSVILTNAAGCDSTFTVELTVNPLTSESEAVIVCEGGNYVLPDGVIVDANGTYTSQTLNLNGCQHTITTTVVVAVASFAQDTIEICGGETFTLLNGDVVSDAGEYNVNVGNINNCDSIVTTFISKCIASGITGVEGNAVASIFPNPSSDLINISFNMDVVNNNLDIQVMNALGQEVDLIENISESSLVVNVSTYSSGMYYLVVRDDANTSIKKFVVSK